MELQDLILQLAEKLEDGEARELFLEIITELGEEVTVDEVLELFENIGNSNNELDSNSSAKALKAFGLSGAEGSPEALHQKFNNEPKTSQEASHNTGKSPVLAGETEDDKLADYAKKLNDGAKAKVKALKTNDKGLPEATTPDFGDDITAIFEGAEFTVDFKEKAQLIFETSIQSKINEHLVYLNEAVAEHMEELDEAVSDIIVEEIQSFMAEAQVQIDKYLDYVVEEFIEKNEVALESGIKVEIAESMFEGFKNLLAEHNVDVSDAKIDLIDEVIEENAEIVESYNKEVVKNIELLEELRTLKKEKLITELTENLTAVEAEKFTSLLDNVEYKDEESFIKKATILAEAYSPSSTPKKVAPQQTLTEDYYTDEVTDEVTVSSDVKRVLAGLDRFGK
jgi:tRNA A37 threonylcarbamoyladenosine modification protein TsaB